MKKIQSLKFFLRCVTKNFWIKIATKFFFVMFLANSSTHVILPITSFFNLKAFVIDQTNWIPYTPHKMKACVWSNPKRKFPASHWIWNCLWILSEYVRLKVYALHFKLHWYVSSLKNRLARFSHLSIWVFSFNICKNIFAN